MTAATSLPAFVLRPMRKTDRNYILDTWRESERAALAHTEGALFGPMQSGTMAAILARPSTVVRVACASSSEDTIAAWAVLRPPVQVLHKGHGRIPEIGPVPVVYYVYTCHDARRFGLAKMLLADVLSRPRAIITSRPAHVRDASGWRPSPIRVPRTWSYVPRAQHCEP